MTEQIDELVSSLVEIKSQITALSQKEQMLKQTIQRYLETTDLKKYSTETHVIELQTKPTFKIPLPSDLRKLMGKEFADRFTIVDPKARNELPPAMIDKLFPIDHITTYVAVRTRRNGNSGAPPEMGT